MFTMQKGVNNELVYVLPVKHRHWNIIIQSSICSGKQWQKL